jgi:eukaryotic-like serine/threonine-protein kinase
MSVVWRAYDDVLQRPVAVKVLAGELACDPGLREAIRREAQAAARLSHPHIAGVYDYGESTVDGEPSPFVVMELVTGEPLSALLSGGARLPWRQAAGICAQVAAALSEAHAHGVVHRDIKPGNVMIGRSGAKVVDFGISAIVGECDLDEDGQLLGTPAYVAPERLDGGRAVTASDVYAVGVLLFRALTGRLPWRVDTAQELLAAHRDPGAAALSGLDDLTDVPAEVRQACRECLSRDPEQRPRSDDLARALGQASGVTVTFPNPVGSRVAGIEPVTAWLGADRPTSPFSAALPPSLLPSLWPGGPKRRVAVALLVVLALASGAVWGTSEASPTARASLGTPPAPPDEDAVAPDCRVEFQVERDWRTGFAAIVTVTNAGRSDMTGSTLRFRFPGEQAIVSGARWRQDGRDVTADLALASGTSVRMPFTARYRRENPLPLSFLVDDVTCQAVVIGPRGVHLADGSDSGGPGSRHGSGSDSSGPGGGGPGSGGGPVKDKKKKDDALPPTRA